MSRDFPKRREPLPRQREAKHAARRRDDEQAMLERQRAQDAFHNNMHRLPAERLAHEAKANK
jgi:hypothetical protein